MFADLSLPPDTGADVDSGFLRQRQFEGKPGQAVALLAQDGTTVVAIGVGPSTTVDRDVLRRAGAALVRAAGEATSLATTLPLVARRPDHASAVVEGIGLGAYRFSGQRRPERRATLERAVIVGDSEDSVRLGAFAVEATARARDWVNTPPRQMTPARLAEIALALGAGAGFGVDVWDEDRIASERLGGLGGVAAGGATPPRLIRLAWEPPRARRTVALVGKGVTFDSGGLSLKTAAGMMTMKSDMGGAAAVIAAVAALATLKVPTRVIGWVAATENMPSGTAICPGDVVVARNGTSIEVLNTDAEGRLILADALSLAAEESPDAIVDLATLTGAQRVALGPGVAAVMGTDDSLVARVLKAGAKAGEPAWRMPLVDGYRKQLDSEVADLRNVPATPAAGAIMAGLFLREFVGDHSWAHLDIAAPSWSEADDGWLTKGGTGWGARTLIELVTGW
ncbi:MAG: leucyl aminopeptidase [Actinomycetota bacterium]|nr:leucyl aminopeptidase [Actinomycetota bacterium]